MGVGMGLCKAFGYEPDAFHSYVLLAGEGSETSEQGAVRAFRVGLCDPPPERSDPPFVLSDPPL